MAHKDDIKTTIERIAAFFQIAQAGDYAFGKG